MNSNQFNLNHLKLFETVYRTRSMTLAAAELHLTQSGVSQHVKSLEDALDARLFDRVKRKLIPTATAARLYETCSKELRGLEDALAEITERTQGLSGEVALGTPIEFGNNVLLPLLAEFGKQQPRVRFQLRYGFSTEMNHGILAGDLDFAFIDDFSLDRRVQHRRVYDETLVLCCSKAFLKNSREFKEGVSGFESLEYIDYQAGAPVLRSWFHHHFRARGLRLNVRVTVMDVQAVARLILAGLGAGVLPEHLVAKLESEGHQIHRFKGCGKPSHNLIHIAQLAGRTHSPAATAVLKFLEEKLQGIARHPFTN